MNTISETSTIYDVAKTKLLTDVGLEQARASLCRFGGAGLLAAMLGAGIGLACFGYSYVVDGHTQAQKMADAMTLALEKARLTTTGTVRLADGSSIGLTPGGRVSLAPNSTVRIDPSSTVRISGMVPADARSSSTMPIVQTSPTPESKVITQYTIFKTVTFDNGQVVTGWRFDNSNQTSPSNQYCYFDEPGDGKTHVRTDLGENGTMFDHLQSRARLDLTAAFANCYWYRGG